MINVFYHQHFAALGGVETMMYELARLCYENNRDLTIVYKTGDPIWIEKIRQFCPCLPLSSFSGKIRCEKAFFNYSTDAIDRFEAKEYIQIIHADFKDVSLKNCPPVTSEKISSYYAVSQNSARSFYELTGIMPKVNRNPLTLDPQPRMMKLVSGQRLTSEKGGKRLEKMIKALDAEKIPYVWHIFSNQRLREESENVIYHKPSFELCRQYMANADYFVLLSDTEGFSYVLYEALMYRVPVIVTPLPVLPELRVDQNNSIVVDFDMHDLDVHKIYDLAGTFDFEYEYHKTDWMKILAKGRSDYKGGKMNYIVRALKDFTAVSDSEVGRPRTEGEEFTVSAQRLAVLENFCFSGKKMKLVEVIAEEKEKTQEEPETASEKPKKTTKTARKSQKKS